LWYVYFLELNNGDIYIGSTSDLRRRAAPHQSGHVVSTSKYLPVVLRSYVAASRLTSCEAATAGWFGILLSSASATKHKPLDRKMVQGLCRGCRHVSSDALRSIHINSYSRFAT
jgi:hypothetical protein